MPTHTGGRVEFLKSCEWRTWSSAADDLAYCGIANVYLAGDWTRTGWPATMEGAVRSGYIAAEWVAQAAGKPAKFPIPDAG